MYKAIVSAITVRPHSNADRLQLGLCHGHQVVVGLNVKDGDLGVFFPTDGELSHEFCLAENLYSESASNELVLDPMPRKFGFFSTKRRVRAQKFRGEKSDGFWTELTSLAWTGVDLASLKVGDQIDSLNGVLVCQKYYSPATRRAMKGGTAPAERLKEVEFPKHVDTSQLRYYVSSIKPGSLITITEKLHGTSGRFGNVLEVTKLKGIRKWWSSLLGKGDITSRWVHLNGTRNVVLREERGELFPGWYGTNEFRYDITRGLNLHKGEIVYFEIVGWVAEGSPIMPAQPVKDDLKDLVKTYGKTMQFSYGLNNGEHTAYVYRITRLNEDGVETELSWSQVKLRARELGLKTVPETYPQFVNTLLTEELESLVNGMLETCSTLDSRHIREGVVVRVDSPEEGTRFFKQKSWSFGVLEGYIKDDESNVDLEEVS